MQMVQKNQIFYSQIFNKNKEMISRIENHLQDAKWKLNEEQQE